jgi:DegV family protein with EDD domain
MSSIKIISDSTCDLDEKLLMQYDIKTIPLMITMGAETLKDGVEVTPEEIFAWSDKTGETPKTAAPAVGDAEDFLRPYAENDDETIFFGISEDMSATCNVLRLAAENIGYKKLHVINSKSLSTGIGLQAIRAAILAGEGHSAMEILKDNENINNKVRASFIVDTLKFLHRGGRCSSVAALIANTLRLKPEIQVSDGKMGVARKYRGNLKSVILKYVQDKFSQIVNADPSRIFITHSGCPKEIIDAVKEYLKGLGIFKEILETRAGSVISSHCGPNTLGILWISN